MIWSPLVDNEKAPVMTASVSAVNCAALAARLTTVPAGRSLGAVHLCAPSLPRNVPSLFTPQSAKITCVPACTSTNSTKEKLSGSSALTPMIARSPAARLVAMAEFSFECPRAGVHDRQHVSAAVEDQNVE